MTEFIHTQNSFANGEIAPEFYLNKNISGLAHLENMDVLAGGGLTLRPGLVDVAVLSGAARIFSFDISQQENYILVFTNFTVSIYSNNTLVQTLVSPWSTESLSKIQFTGRGDSMIFVHPDICPYILTKSGNSFSLGIFSFYDSTGIYPQFPLMKYDEMRGISITLTSGPYGSMSAVFTASGNYWTSSNVGTIVQFGNQTWEIIEYVNPTVVYAKSVEEYTLPGTAITDWLESAFDSRHGWPRSVTFHQDRLVFGGTYYNPGGIWMSQTGEHHNFNAGTGLDDEAITTTLLSKERQEICNLISSDKLQVLTSHGEWAIANQPLTPSNINIKQHTTVGSVTGYSLTPQKIEGETVFVSNTMKDIRKLSLDTLGDKYNADDLCIFAKHLINEPTDIAYNKVSKQLYIVNKNGDIAVLNQNTNLGISAWARYTTYGKFTSVAISGGETFVIIEHHSTYKLAKFSHTALTDSTTYKIEFSASGVPMNFSGHRPVHLRLRKISLRLMNTKSAFINNMRIELPNEVYLPSSPGFSGDISMNMLGSQIDESTPLWTLHGDEPMPITVFSVTIYGQYEI